MGIPISNAKDRPLSANSGTLPNVSGAMLNYFQPMTFTVVVKTIVNFKVVETPTNIDFQGVWQPFSSKQLSMKPEGERAWSWFTLHAQPSLVLKPDDVVTYLGVQYRVMQQSDFRLYGYVLYQLIQDFTGSGP